MTGQGFSLNGSEVNTWEWLVPLLVAAPCIMVVGLVVQQAFLRWNAGPGAAPGADHDRRLGDRRRPDHRPLPAQRLPGGQRLGGQCSRPDLARLDRPVRRPARRRSPVLARATGRARDRHRGRRRSLAVALPDQDGDEDPRGRRRREDDLGARDQHPESRSRSRSRSAAASPRSERSSGPRSRTSRPVRTGSGCSTRWWS